MSVEIIILCVTGVVACLTYLVKHFKKSECWSKDSCCVCKMDKNDSKSDLSIESTENKEKKESKKEYDTVNEQDLKVTVSSTI